MVTMPMSQIRIIGMKNIIVETKNALCGPDGFWTK
jgi:hypothetical protein